MEDLGLGWVFVSQSGVSGPSDVLVMGVVLMVRFSEVVSWLIPMTGAWIL